MKEKKDFINGEAANNAQKTRSRFYAAIASLVLSAAAFGLAFLPGAGIYFLIASVLLEICSLSFSASQKKINPFPAVKILQIFAYILLFLSVALFLGGLIYSSSV